MISRRRFLRHTSVLSAGALAGPALAAAAPVPGWKTPSGTRIRDIRTAAVDIGNKSHLVKVVAEDGRFGLVEAYPKAEVADDIAAIKRKIIGEDPLAVEVLTAKLVDQYHSVIASNWWTYRRVDEGRIGRFRGREQKACRRNRPIPPDVAMVQVSEKEPMNDELENDRKPRTRRSFEETYKRNAVALTLSGERTVERIAEEMGVRSSLLRSWRRQYGPMPLARVLQFG